MPFCKPGFAPTLVIVALSLSGCVSPTGQSNERFVPSRMADHQQNPGPLASNLRIPADRANSPLAKASVTPEILLARGQVPAAPTPELPPKIIDEKGPEQKPLIEAPAAAVNPTVKLQQIHRDAAERFAAIDSYIVRMRRREQINGRDHPEEIMLLKYRKNPLSIYFKWLGKEGAGREAIYVKGQYDDKLHTLLAAGDVPLMPAGKRLALSPDSSLVRSSSRHSITEAGIGNLIERYGNLVRQFETGQRQAAPLAYLGAMQRPEFTSPCEGVEQTIRPGTESLLPRGGRRLWVFDSQTKLPVLLITKDHADHEVEYYSYDRFQFPVRLDTDDFNPDKLWAQNKNPLPARNLVGQKGPNQ